MAGAVDSTEQFVIAAVERSQPNADKPKVGDDALEERLRDLEKRNALCYADCEMKSHRLRRLARRITGSGDSIPVPLEAEISAVHHISEARAKLAVNDD